MVAAPPHRNSIETASRQRARRHDATLLATVTITGRTPRTSTASRVLVHSRICTTQARTRR